MSETKRTREHFFRHAEVHDLVDEFAVKYKLPMTEAQHNTLTTYLHSRLNDIVRDSALPVGVLERPELTQ